jgi:hypothetical protein
MVLMAPVEKHGSTKKSYVDVQGNGRMYDSFLDAWDVYEQIHPDREAVIVMVMHTHRES